MGGTSVDKPGTLDGDAEDVAGLYLVTDAPKSYCNAMNHPDADEWIAAVTEEYNALLRRDIFEEVERSEGVKVHGGLLVFAEKIGAEGEVTKKKARLVAKGYTEVWGEDFWNTYSPTLGHNTLLSCLTYAATRDLEIHHLDAVAAYLNSNLHKEIYLHPPEGIPSSPGTIW